MLIVESQSLDVYRNLAIEEYLMEYASEYEAVLFLWRSDCAVVLGKNQNPWRECRLDLMRSEGVPLARRISGGGTVYHDAGNLNYCVIVDRAQYREERAYEMVSQALATLGVQVERTGTSNLSAAGRKFSGNAFCFRKGRALHHGTLLLRTDLERLKRYLGAMPGEIETHAIRSVPALVMNLGLEVREVSDALCDGFRLLYGDGEVLRWKESDLDGTQWAALIGKQCSWGWKYGATPKFSMEWKGLRLEVAGGRVVRTEGTESKELLGRGVDETFFSLSCWVD